MSDFTERFKLVFEKTGITQRELALKTGLSVASICKYLSNQRSPSPDNEAKIIKALGCNQNDFYSDEKFEVLKKNRLKNIDYYDLVYIIKTKLNMLSQDEKESLKEILSA